MKVSLIQMNSINDKGANITAAQALIERAVAEEGPDWLLLPEQFDWAGGSRAEKLAAAERLPGGPAYEMARGQAIKHRIFVHAGSIMEKIDGEDRYHNTSVVFQSRGRGDRPLPQDPSVRRDDARTELHTRKARR